MLLGTSADASGSPGGGGRRCAFPPYGAVQQSWLDRCGSQVAGVLDALEADRAQRTTPFWFGAALGHPDIAVACALRFTAEAHQTLFDLARRPALAAHASRCEVLAPFQAVVQPFIPPS